MGKLETFWTVTVLQVSCEHLKRRGVPRPSPCLANTMGLVLASKAMRRPGQVWRRGGRNAPVACPHSQPKAGSAARPKPTGHGAGRGAGPDALPRLAARGLTPGTSSLSEWAGNRIAIRVGALAA